MVFCGVVGIAFADFDLPGVVESLVLINSTMKIILDNYSTGIILYVHLPNLTISWGLKHETECYVSKY